MSINKTKKSNVLNIKQTPHTNLQGGVSYTISDPIWRLKVAAASCFFGEPQYTEEVKGKKAPALYGTAHQYSTYLKQNGAALRNILGGLQPPEWDGMNSAERMELAIDQALDFNPALTLQVAAELRNMDHIRVTPQIILVRAAHHKKVKGTGLIRQYAPMIIKRADEPSTGLAYHIAKFGKGTPVPNSLKKAWRDSLANFSEYQLAKYRMENREVKTVDVINLVHPPRTEAIDKLVKGELKLTVEDTWEALVSKEGSNKAAWLKAFELMGHMALLRNLRNLSQHGVPDAMVAQKLVEGAPTGKQLPFRYFTAYKAVEGTVSGKIKDAIEESMLASIGNMPHLPGKTAIIIDESGSMETKISEMGNVTIKDIAEVTAVITAMASDDADVIAFATNVKPVEVRKRQSIFDQMAEIRKVGNTLGGGTEFHKFWQLLLQNGTKYDNIIVISDMQAAFDGNHSYYYGSNGKVKSSPEYIKDYRAQVNPNAQIFLMQVAGHQDSVVPQYFNKTYLLGGWTENIIKFAAEMASLTR